MLYLGTSFADATVYGTFDQAYRTDKAKGLSGIIPVDSRKTSLDGVLNGGSALGFKGSEDLGGGTSVSFLTEFGLGIDGSFGSSITNRQSYLGLGGDWGNLTAGRQYSAIFLAGASIDPHGSPNMNGSTVLGNIVTAPSPGTSALITSSDVRTSNLVRYASPSFSGVKVTIGKSFGEATTGTYASSNASTTNSLKGDGSEYGISWTGAGLQIGYNIENWSNSALYENITSGTLASAGDRKNNLLTASYDFGIAKVSLADGKSSIGSAYNKATFYGVSVPLGQASLLLSSGSGSRTSNGTGLSKVSTAGLMIGANYSLSKRSMLYFRNGTDTDKNTTQTKISTTAFGLIHSF